MGSRLGVILKTNSGWELYYDHWAAMTIGADIALDGCENTIDRVRQMGPLGAETPEQWENALLIEGSLLIDTTTKTVVWAEESYTAYLPRIINALVEYTWPGWRCIWSAESEWGVLRMAGVDPTPFFTNRRHYQQELTDTSEFLPWNSDEHQGVFSVRLESGETVTWNGERFLLDTAELGPEAILSVATQVRDRAADGEPVLYHHNPPAQQPVAGVQVDFVEKRVQWWSLADESGGVPAFNKLWDGWALESMGDAYEWQQELISVPLRTWKQDVHECHTWIQQHCYKLPRGDSATEVVGFFDDDATAGSVAVESVPITRAGAIKTLRFLSKLAEGEPLPPARFVNRWGEIRSGSV